MGGYLYLIVESTVKVGMKMHILEIEDQIQSLHRDYLFALRNAGFENLLQKNPHITIKPITHKPDPGK